MLSDTNSQYRYLHLIIQAIRMGQCKNDINFMNELEYQPFLSQQAYYMRNFLNFPMHIVL